ncbi:MAG: galactokinase [Holophagales bacterium]|nr:galactokinase [Holophagales bacterium]MXX61824.1 galactokinase [Holophagales bacterium]MYC09425.1 galactokinase [Holophagales bacterium]MYD21620.1 galactokinase [Holophagales bacterium]MYI31712.1 galactokinase [Holophagales bacterium]
MKVGDLVDAFRKRFGAEPKVIARAPGRANLLGAHVDYSEGWVLPAAIDRAVWVAARRARGKETRLAALDLGEEAAVDVVEPAPPVAERGRPSSWVDYPQGLAWALGRRGIEVPPIEAVFGGDLPIGAGVSSSAAVEMAFLVAWEQLAGFELDGIERAGIGRQVENEYVGVQSGIMDQFASVHGREGHALLLDCRSLEHELIPTPEELVFLVADTGVRRALASGTGFNDRKSECFRAADLLRPHLPGLFTLRDLEPGDLDRLRHVLEPPLDRRARHVVTECRRVRDGAEALRQGDLHALGDLMAQSHRSSRNDYDVSIEELDVLQEAAAGAEGCYGARLTGAGFGGCVTAITSEAAAGHVREQTEAAFEQRFGRRPEIHTCRVGDGAGVVSAS